MATALLILDLQRDLLPGGILPVPEADQIVPMANRLQPYFDVVACTQNWFPPNHRSFSTHYPGHKPGDVVDVGCRPLVLWPPHCVRDTAGADFPAELNVERAHVVRKGTLPEVDSYSAFYDRERRRDTGLAELLHRHGVREVYLMGIAVETCVRNTAMDALELGFRTFIVREGVRGLQVHPEDTDQILEALEKTGARVVYSGTVLATFEPQTWH